MLVFGRGRIGRSGRALLQAGGQGFDLVQLTCPTTGCGGTAHQSCTATTAVVVAVVASMVMLLARLAAAHGAESGSGTVFASLQELGLVVHAVHRIRLPGAGALGLRQVSLWTGTQDRHPAALQSRTDLLVTQQCLLLLMLRWQ